MSPNLSRNAVCASILLLAILAAASCSSGSAAGGGPDASNGDSTSGGACTPGDQKSCACPGSSITGAQVCNGAGSAYGPCTGCQASGSSSGASGSSSGGSSGGSSGSSSGTSGGSSGSSSGGMADAGGDSTGGDASCDGGSLMPVCAACVDTSAANPSSPCTPQANACAANPDCQSLNQCIGNCNGVPTCPTMCESMYPNGVADMNALNACICEPCVCKQACASVCP